MPIQAPAGAPSGRITRSTIQHSTTTRDQVDSNGVDLGLPVVSREHGRGKRGAREDSPDGKSQMCDISFFTSKLVPCKSINDTLSCFYRTLNFQRKNSGGSWDCSGSQNHQRPPARTSRPSYQKEKTQTLHSSATNTIKKRCKSTKR